MPKTYTQLCFESRETISQLHAQGYSCRQIAATLGRAPSTIARELHRNQAATTGYRALHAQKLTRARRWRGARLERDAVLRDEVLHALRAGLSPEQIAGRRQQQGESSISHESIYRFIYAQLRRHQQYAWRHYLPRAKSERGYRRRKRSSPALCMAHRTSIAERPLTIHQQCGHWEADLMSFTDYREHVLVLHERQSKLTLCFRQDRKHADRIAAVIYDSLKALPPRLRRSMTFDNGTEFALHYQLRRRLKMRTYFCDPRSPWQKGGVENSIGRLRRYLPRHTHSPQMPGLSNPGRGVCSTVALQM
jgi:transposase, IS30 family